MSYRRNTIQEIRAKRRDKFKRQCDADSVQQITCAGCKQSFGTRYRYEIHRVYSPGYYTNTGQQIDGELVCPDDTSQGNAALKAHKSKEETNA